MPETDPIARLIDETDPPGLLRAPRPGAWPAERIASGVSSLSSPSSPRSAMPGTHPRLALIRALVALWHDRWDEAHAIVQDREGDRDADYLHAILHRREPDDANARSWLRAVGNHPIHHGLAGAARAHGRLDLVVEGRWSPAAFVGACAVARGGTDPGPLINLQRRELAALLRHLLAA